MQGDWTAALAIDRVLVAVEARQAKLSRRPQHIARRLSKGAAGDQAAALGFSGQALQIGNWDF